MIAKSSRSQRQRANNQSNAGTSLTSRSGMRLNMCISIAPRAVRTAVICFVRCLMVEPSQWRVDRMCRHGRFTCSSVVAELLDPCPCLQAPCKQLLSLQGRLTVVVVLIPVVLFALFHRIPQHPTINSDGLHLDALPCLPLPAPLHKCGTQGGLRETSIARSDNTHSNHVDHLPGLLGLPAVAVDITALAGCRPPLHHHDHEHLRADSHPQAPHRTEEAGDDEGAEGAKRHRRPGQPLPRDRDDT